MAAVAVTSGLFIGVDSGGTRTNVHLELRSHRGEPLQEQSYESSESLSGALPNELIDSALRKILAPLETQAGLLNDSGEVPAHVWISAAGYTPWTRDFYLLALNELAPKLLNGRIHSIGVANDAVSLLLGSKADGVIVAGTGSSVIVQARDGRFYQSGGHEWVACDYGSGFWIGLRGIRKAYRDLENGRRSALLQRLCEHYAVEVEDQQGLVEELRRLAIGDKDFKKDIARFAPGVCAAAERGDNAAQNLVKEEAEDLADVTASALRRHFTRDELATGVRLLQCGSLLSDSFYCSSFESQVERRLLSGSDRQAALTWERVVTGIGSAMTLARSLAVNAVRFVQLDIAFRPAVVER